GVELLESLGGGDDAGLIEPILERLLEVEHRAVVGDLELEGEGGGRPGDDRGVHGSSPSGEGWNVPQVQDLCLHQSPVEPCSRSPVPKKSGPSRGRVYEGNAFEVF